MDTWCSIPLSSCRRIFATTYRLVHFTILKPIKEGRVIQTLTTALRDNLDTETTVAGLRMKMYAGYIFSTLVWNDVVKSENEKLISTFSA